MSDPNLIDALKAVVREAVREELAQVKLANGSNPDDPQAAIIAKVQQKVSAGVLLFSTAEAALLLGVPETWLAAKARAGGIRTVRCGHYVNFSFDDLQRFIKKGGQNGKKRFPERIGTDR